MKRSNIIIMLSVILAITWFLLSGWMHANAYKMIKSDIKCSYAFKTDKKHTQSLSPFRNVKVLNFNQSSQVSLWIKPGNEHTIDLFDEGNSDVEKKVSDDTLYLKVKNNGSIRSFSIRITTPILNSYTSISTPKVVNPIGEYGIVSDISECTGDHLTIYNYGSNRISLANNNQKNLILKGDFCNRGEIDISGYDDMDSITVDVAGKKGLLSFNAYKWLDKPRHKQWIYVKLPQSFVIKAESSIAKNIIIKR